MSVPEPGASTPAPDDKPIVEALVADCIEALERGEVDPVQRVCSARPDLLTRVQRRLTQLANRGLLPVAHPQPSGRIGPYRILRELGSGGMGTVLLAEQEQPVRREVALKVIKLGMDTREVVARFQAERQALARMNHPNIAQVFDAGITDDGRPYFAMEYVGGEWLTTWCDRAAATPELRVRLLATVCRAVQHAHDRGFLHRDLKPSNLLVVVHEGQAVPKVIDFGIAKATSDAAEVEGQTRAGQLLGTPEYMSPEQAAGGGFDLDTRTDVWSLGVVLYELMCGELPFDSQKLRRATRHELERILQDELPTLPSKRLSVVGDEVLVARGGQRTQVQRRVAGDLDWITLKALAKRPEERYPSALAFAEDLERWLRHEPVHAAPPGRTYRLRKFVRRHRVPVAAGAVVLVSLVVGLVVSVGATLQAQAAQRQEAAALADMRVFYDLARDAVGNLVDTAHERLADVPQADAARRVMLDDAIRFYGAMRERRAQDPALRIDLAQASHRIAVLQERLGQVTEAATTATDCLQAAQALRAERPDDPEVLQLLIEARAHVARLSRRNGRPEDAVQQLRTAIAETELLRTLPSVPLVTVDRLLGRLSSNLGMETDDASAAIVHLEAAQAAFERVAAQRPDDTGLVRDQVHVSGLLAKELTKLGRGDEAASVLGQARERLAALPRGARVGLRTFEGRILDQFVQVLHRLRRLDEARAVQLDANRLHTELAEEHPDQPGFQDDVAAGLHRLAQIAEDQAKIREALALATEAAARREALAAKYPADHRQTMRYVRSVMTKLDYEVTLWQTEGEDVVPAVRSCERATEVIDRVYAAHGDDVEVVITFAACHNVMAQLRAATGDTERQFAEYERVRAVLTTQIERSPDDPELHYQLALVWNSVCFAHLKTGDAVQAKAAGEAAVANLRECLLRDARHRGALDVVDQVVARTASATEQVDGPEAGLEVLAQLGEMEWLDAGSRESGAMLWAEQVLGALDHPTRQLQLARVRDRLLGMITARGPLAEALQRPTQKGSVSHPKSRLRDLDLRLRLGDVLGELGDRERQAAVLEETRQLAVSMTTLGAARVRDLYGQLATVAIEAGDVPATMRHVETLVAQAGKDGQARHVAARLSARAATAAAATDAGLARRAADAAVEHLRAALAAGAIPMEVAAGPEFVVLRDRADYQDLVGH